MSGSQQHKVIIGLPMKTDKRIAFGLAKFFARYDNQIADIIDVEGTDGCINRNMIILHFLSRKDSDETHLLLIDADTIPPKNAIDNLFALDKNIVCGIVPIGKFGKAYWNIMPVDTSINEGFIPKAELNFTSKPFLIRKTGPACMLIERKVLEKLKYPYFRNDCEKVGGVTNFLMRQPYTAGDFYFCQQVLDAGFEIWAEPKVQCGHFTYLDLSSLN